MNENAVATMRRSDKGPIAPPPALAGTIGAVSEVISAWPGVVPTVHWDLEDATKVDGIDFYVRDEELGHVHLDGSIHLATNATLGAALIAESLARRFPYARDWVCENVDRVGIDAAIALFRRNYDRLAKPL